MKRERTGFTAGDWGILSAGLFLLIILQIAGADKPQPDVPLVSEPVFELYDQAAVPGSGKAAKAYEAFRANPGYHGAFAIGSDGAFGWSDNYTTQTFADTAALAYCAEHADDCRIIARLGPLMDHRVGDLPLSRGLAEAMLAYASYPGAKALAVAETGTWGVSWNYTTKIEARTSALAHCNSRLATPKPRGVPKRPCLLLWEG